MDREGDNYELFADLIHHGDRFVVRLNYDRNLITESAPEVPATVQAARPPHGKRSTNPVLSRA